MDFNITAFIVGLTKGLLAGYFFGFILGVVFVILYNLISIEWIVNKIRPLFKKKESGRPIFLDWNTGPFRFQGAKDPEYPAKIHEWRLKLLMCGLTVDQAKTLLMYLDVFTLPGGVESAVNSICQVLSKGIVEIEDRAQLINSLPITSHFNPAYTDSLSYVESLINFLEFEYKRIKY